MAQVSGVPFPCAFMILPPYGLITFWALPGGKEGRTEEGRLEELLELELPELELLDDLDLVVFDVIALDAVESVTSLRYTQLLIPSGYPSSTLFWLSFI